MKIKTLALAGLLATSSLATNAQAPQTKATTNKAKTEVAKTITSTPQDKIAKIDTLDHKTFITIPVDDIIKEFGKEKGLILINKHALIEINKIRKEHGVKPLKLHPDLMKISQKYSEKMAKTGKFDHIDENGDGPGDRAEKDGYMADYVGESIYYGTSIFGAILWRKKSPPHFKGMINKDYIQLGFGYYSGYRVNMFSSMKYVSNK